MNSNLFDAAKKRDLEWAVWKEGERMHSIPAEREAEKEARAPRPEEYTFAGRD